jgi:hypothetical protein
VFAFGVSAEAGMSVAKVSAIIVMFETSFFIVSSIVMFERRFFLVSSAETLQGLCKTQHCCSTSDSEWYPRLIGNKARFENAVTIFASGELVKFLALRAEKHERHSILAR